MEKSYKSLGYFFLLLIPLTFLGFYNTYFVQFPDFEENTTEFIHFHAFIASIWILFLIAQPILIQKRKNKLHRTIGKLSYIVFPILILSFIPQMIRLVNSENPEFVFFPMADAISLILFYSLAIYNRKNIARHMRYMIGTAIVFLGPTFGRIGPLMLGWSESATQDIQYGIIYLILVGLIFLNKRNSKKFQPYLLIMGIWVIHQITYYIVI
jgi:hypothetical protein